MEADCGQVRVSILLARCHSSVWKTRQPNLSRNAVLALCFQPKCPRSLQDSSLHSQGSCKDCKLVCLLLKLAIITGSREALLLFGRLLCLLAVCAGFFFFLSRHVKYKHVTFGQFSPMKRSASLETHEWSCGTENVTIRQKGEQQINLFSAPCL